MLVFGGLLFSSGATPCKTKTMPDDKFKRQFERQYGRRTIRFHNVPEKIAQEPNSVLQQENNDIVDAVRKEYQDLPQFQPVSGLVGGDIMGLHGQTCVVNVCRPEVRDRGVSPIHSIRNGNTSDYDISSYRDKEVEITKQKKNKQPSSLLRDTHSTCDDIVTQRIPSASSGIGTHSPESFEADSLEEYPLSENDSLAEAVMPASTGSGFAVESTHPSFAPRIDRGLYTGGRLSVLRLESAPSCLCVSALDCPMHRGTKAGETDALDHVALITNARLTWGDIAQNPNSENLANLRLSTPSADVSGPLNTRKLQERGQSPLRREDLEKWLSDVEASREASDEQHTKATLALRLSDADTKHPKEKRSISHHGRVCAPLQESLQLLKRLQLVSEDDLPKAHTKSSVHRGGRTSCLKTVRAPSSLCLCAGKCNEKCQIEDNSGQLLTPSFEESTDVEENTDILSSEYQNDSTRTQRVARGGRLSSLNQVRASSDMCIQGLSCQFHCHKPRDVESIAETGQTRERGIKERKYLEFHPQEIQKEVKELRGASAFGEPKALTNNDPLQDGGISFCSLGQRTTEKEQHSENNLRGASSFGCSKTQQIGDQSVRGASSFALESPRLLHIINHGQIERANDTQSKLDESRGASCFDESVAGTPSVTLSIAVESGPESDPGCMSSDNKQRGSLSEIDACLNRTAALARISKTTVKSKKFSVDVNNNSSRRSENQQERNIPEREEFGVKKGNVQTTENRGQQKKPIGFNERILKVGKDAAMMSSLLNALRRDGEQKRKEKDKENTTNEGGISVRKLKFSVFYKEAHNSTSLLYVNVIGLEFVSEEIITSSHSIYVKFCLFPKFTTWRRTKTVNISGKQLVFKDHFIISGVKAVDLENAILRFIVVCIEEQERVIGQLEVPLAGLNSGDKLTRTCALQPPGAMDDGIA